MKLGLAIIKRHYKDRTDLTAFNHELFHATDFEQGKTYEEASAGDYPTNDTGPAAAFGTAVAAGLPDLSKEQARRSSTRGCRVGRALTDLRLHCILVLTLLVVGCSLHQGEVIQVHQADRDHGPETPSSHLEFTVRLPEGDYVPRVTVSAVNAEGLQELGTTDAYGSLQVDIELLRHLRPFVIIFCHERLPCGAIVVGDNFFGYREQNVILPPAVLY